MSFSKVLFLSGAVAGLIWLTKLKNLSEKITTSISNPRIHKIDLSGIVFRTEVNIHNPTKDSISITQPTVTVFSGDKIISQSTSNGKVIPIKPLATTVLDTIELQISWGTLTPFIVGLLGKIPTLVQAFAQKNTSGFASILGIPLEMTFSTYANGIFYQSAKERIV